MKKQRDNYFDTFRFIAIFVIYTRHFFYFFYPDFGKSASFFPVRYAFTVLTGKLGLMMMTVLLGYFAYRSGRKRRKSLVNYMFGRYSFFVICGLMVNMLYGIYGGRTISEIILESFTVGSVIFPTYWCMREFLLASVLCYMVGSCSIPLGAVVGLCAVSFLNKLWLTGISFIGILLSYAMEHREKRWITALTAAAFIGGAVYLYVKPVETALLFLVQGTFCAALILLAAGSDRARKIIANPVTGALGRNSLAIFLLHPFVYTTLGNELFIRFSGLGVNLSMILSWIVCSAVLCLAAFPVYYVINYIYGKWNELLNKIIDL